MCSAKALSKYTEMVDNLIRQQKDKLEAASDEARLRLREWDMPEALQASHTPMTSVPFLKPSDSLLYEAGMVLLMPALWQKQQGRNCICACTRVRVCAHVRVCVCVYEWRVCVST